MAGETINANFWNLQIAADGVIHLYDLGEADDPGTIPDIDARITWARGQWGVPTDWYGHPEQQEHGWDVAILSAPVHPTLLEQAKVETWDGYEAPTA